MTKRTRTIAATWLVLMAPTGCASDGDDGAVSIVPAATPTATPSPAASPSPQPGASPSPSPSPSASPLPIGSPSPVAAPGWTPRVADTWQWQLSGTLNTRYDVAVYDIDLFDTPAATIAALKTAGRRVVCYFSAGSGENWRSDYARFAAADLGNALDGWAGERWLDIRSANVRAVMVARLQLAAGKGCDGVEPDNVDAFEADNRAGFALTAADQLSYNRYLADQAHALGLAIALKNDTAQVAALAPSFDFAVNEQCHEYSECGVYSAFTGAGKPVFNVEYAARYRNNTGGARDTLCATATRESLRTLVLPVELNDAFRFTCG